jgi:hypothetical protein
MSLLKDERTLRLDDLDIAVSEADVLYRDLDDHIDDPALHALILRHADAQADTMAHFDELRRSLGDLPQAGDPERSHLGAAGAYLRAMVLPGDTTTHYIESLLEATSKVNLHVERALDLELDPALNQLLQDVKAANEAFATALRARS